MKVLKPFLKAVLECYDEGKSFDDILRLSEFYQKRITNTNITELFEGFEERESSWCLANETLNFDKTKLFELEVTVDMLASIANAISVYEGQEIQILIKRYDK